MPGAATASPPYRPAQINIFGKGGATDQTSEVQAALDKAAALSYSYADSGVGRVPEINFFGLCGISSGLTFAAGGPARIRAATPYAGLRAISAGTYDMLTVGDGLIAGGGTSFVDVEGLLFTANAQKTGGAGLKMYTASSCRVRRNQLFRQYDGIRAERGCNQSFYESNDIQGFTRYGIYCGVTGTDQGTNGYGSEQHFIRNMIYGGDPGSLGSGHIGILHAGGDACRYLGNSIVSAGVGMQVAPGFTPVPEVGHCSMIDNIISDNTVDCLVLDGGTYAVAKWLISDNHLVYNLATGYGLKLTGSNLKNINVRGNVIHANASGGIYLGSGPRDIQIDNNIITGNGTAGIVTQSGAQAFSIRNNRIQASGGAAGSSTQPHGISWGGSHENYIFAHNDLRGNTTAATTGTAGGSNKIDTPNLS